MNCKQQFKASKYTDWTAKKLEFKKLILSNPNVKPEKGKWNSETVLLAWENQQEQAGICEGQNTMMFVLAQQARRFNLSKE